MSGQKQPQPNNVDKVEVMNLTTSSQLHMQKHQATLLNLEVKKVAATLVDVPTLPKQVRNALRQLGLPVRIFGENLANVRDRLRLELARQQVISGIQQQEIDSKHEAIDEEVLEDDEEVTKYTRAVPALIVARQEFAKFSLQRAALRLERERLLRYAAMKRKRSSSNTISRPVVNDNDDDDAEMTTITSKMPSNDDTTMLLDEIDKQCIKAYKAVRQITLEGSQYGDSRALSCLCHQNVINDGKPLVATGSWTGTIHLWDGSSPALTKLAEKTMCHEDRIMGVAMMQQNNINSNNTFIATASIDLTAKVWKLLKNDIVMDYNDDGDEISKPKQHNDNSPSFEWSMSEQSHLKGHAARLCRVAFHPMNLHVATTSFDHSWRLWDIETSQVTTNSGGTQEREEILLQDGHSREVYGIGFHPDGSLCATTDFAGVVHLWDLRTGKSIRHFLGHARRVLNADFHPVNGFQLATAGDDGTIRIWDLRKRKQVACIPAHSNVITRLRFESVSGEYLASSSFDGTVKLWNSRDWKMLNQLQGHEGTVTGVEILDNNTLVSCGFDKTLKMWR